MTTQGFFPCLLWEAGKGGQNYRHLIPKKKENAKVVDLEQTIKLLEESHRTLPDEPTLQQIKKAKLQLSEIVN